MSELPSQYPALDDATLGEVIVTSYKARDGLDIQAFVTLPPGMGSLEEAKNLPFALLPHGGPTARDFYGFDWLAQFLAHQGFGVMQMNFRGSSGYGEEFKSAGDRQWGQAMQDDITDGAKWLIGEGMADAGKTSIIGASYGGYAALMGAVKTPDLYRCAVAINAVTDLPKILKDGKDYVGGTYGTRHIGRLWGDRKMLAENSPARRADDIKIPTLIIMSEEDRVVRPDHSEDMHRALKRAGKDTKLVTLPKGSHYLNVGTNRITMLREMDGFLSRCR
nr:prolyl oligopeptidase family serine peptidase [Parvularcula mediterranea]